MKTRDLTRLLRRFEFSDDHPDRIRLERKMAACYREFLRNLDALGRRALARPAHSSCTPDETAA